MALPHIPHNSEQLAALILRVRLLIDVIVPILKSPGRIRHRQRIRKRLPSRCDGPIRFIFFGIGRASRGDPFRDDQSMSGGGGSAGLKSDPSGVQMDELGIGGQV